MSTAFEKLYTNIYTKVSFFSFFGDIHQKEITITGHIAESKEGYIVFFSSGNVGAAYYEYDEENAKKIFAEIGVSL